MSLHKKHPGSLLQIPRILTAFSHLYHPKPGKISRLLRFKKGACKNSPKTFLKLSFISIANNSCNFLNHSFSSTEAGGIFCRPNVGEDSILPRGTISQYRAIVGRIRAKLYILPFTGTHRRPTWREDTILPLAGRLFFCAWRRRIVPAMRRPVRRWRWR